MDFDFQRNLYIVKALRGVLPIHELCVFTLMNQEQFLKGEQTCVLSLGEMVRELQISKRIVKTAIKNLIEKEFIKIVVKGTGATCTVYEILRPIDYSEFERVTK